MYVHTAVVSHLLNISLWLALEYGYINTCFCTAEDGLIIWLNNTQHKKSRLNFITLAVSV